MSSLCVRTKWLRVVLPGVHRQLVCMSSSHEDENTSPSLQSDKKNKTNKGKYRKKTNNTAEKPISPAPTSSISILMKSLTGGGRAANQEVTSPIEKVELKPNPMIDSLLGGDATAEGYPPKAVPAQQSVGELKKSTSLLSSLKSSLESNKAELDKKQDVVGEKSSSLTEQPVLKETPEKPNPSALSSLKASLEQVGKSLGGDDQDKHQRIKQTLLSKLMEIEKDSTNEEAAAVPLTQAIDQEQYQRLLGLEPSQYTRSSRSQSWERHASKPRDGEFIPYNKARVKLFLEIIKNNPEIGYTEANDKADKIFQQAQDILYTPVFEAAEGEQEPENLCTSQEDKTLLDFALARLRESDNHRKPSFTGDSVRMLGSNYVPTPNRIALKRPTEPKYVGMNQFFDFSDLPKSRRKKKIVFENADGLTTHNLGFWKDWDEHLNLLDKQMLGPKNAIEEQIEWTKQGQMWPYPINNEYMLGPEQKVSFADHVFLEPQWQKHKVPRSKSVDHFMELVMVGLSKNSCMSVEKKAAHIDWFANYFKAEMAGKYHDILQNE